MKVLKNLLQFKYIFILTIFIILLSIYRVSIFKSKININQTEFIFKISNINYKENRMTITLKGEETIIGYLNRIDKNLSIGDKVYVKGKLRSLEYNTIPNTFNYKKYLFYNKIFYLLDIEDIKVINKSNNLFINLKRKIINLIETKNNKEYLYALVLGNTDYLDEEVYSKYKDNGVTHLFAVSGMHVSFLTSLIFFALSLFRVREIRKYIITFIILLYFAFLSNFSYSVLRSIIFFLLIGFNKVYRLKINYETLLFLTLDIILLMNPGSLYSYSLIFSFVITFFLIYYSKDLFYFKSLFYTSIISFLASVPILISLNYEINLFSIVNNLLFIPLVSYVIYPLCIFSLLFDFLEPILSICINFMQYINEFVSVFELNVIFPKLNVFTVIFYYIILILYRYFRSNKLLIIYFCLIFIMYSYKNFEKETLVNFFDVGQGDAVLLKVKNESLLIDTGGNFYNDYDLNNMIDYFKSEGIRKINTLIITHGDYDHMGWSFNLVNNFKVEKVIFNCGLYNDLEQELIKVLDKKKIKYYSCINELNIDENKLYFLQTKEYDNENDNSNVIYTDLNGYKFMFMGDAGIEIEKTLISKYNLQNIDVLKVGHHGSKTSSSNEFINKINPKYSVISVGKNNRYGHPNKEVLDNLRDSKIYRTDEEGSIIFKIKNNKLKIETCSP